jgi:hypothetical protein
VDDNLEIEEIEDRLDVLMLSDRDEVPGLKIIRTFDTAL